MMLCCKCQSTLGQIKKRLASQVFILVKSESVQEHNLTFFKYSM